MERAIVLLNGKAGNNFGRRNCLRILERLYQAGYETLVIPVGPDYPMDLPTFFKEHADSFDLCVSVGGDGSLHHAVNGMLKSGCDQPIAYIPCGTTNDFAKSLELNMDLNSPEPLFKKTILKLDAGLFNKEYFTYVAAFGALTDVSYNTPQEAKNALGYTAYALNSLSELPNSLNAKIKVKIESDEYCDEGTYMYGSVSNCYSVAGVHTPLLGNVSLNDGLFEVILIKSPKNITELLEITSSLLSGEISPSARSLFKLFSTRKVTFTFQEETEWTLDGEFGGKLTKAAVSVRKQKLKLLR